MADTKNDTPKKASKKALGDRFDLSSPTGRVQALYADRTENPVHGRGDTNAQGTETRPKNQDGPTTGLKDALNAIRYVVDELAANDITRGEQWVGDKFKEVRKLIDEAEKAQKARFKQAKDDK